MNLEYIIILGYKSPLGMFGSFPQAYTHSLLKHHLGVPWEMAGLHRFVGRQGESMHHKFLLLIPATHSDAKV